MLIQVTFRFANAQIYTECRMIEMVEKDPVAIFWKGDGHGKE